MKKILVTGDGGYIGSSLVQLLLKNKYEVVGLDTDFFKKNLGNKKAPKYKRIVKDVRRIGKKNLLGIDCVIHLAALSNDPMGAINPKVTEQINYESTVRFARMAKEAGVGRFLFSSSCSIYGIIKNNIVNEKSKVNPITEYAKTKIKSEKDLIKLADDSFCVGILRNSTVYGYSPKFRCDLVVNDFAVSALINKQIIVLSDGTPWRPQIDVRDLSKIFMAFIEIDSKKINKEIFNVGFSENNFQVKTIADIVSNLLHHGVVFTNQHGKGTRSYKVDFNKFEKLFPEITQEWPIDKSVSNLIAVLSVQLSLKKFKREDYIRLNILQNLIKEKKVNKKLYWI